MLNLKLKILPNLSWVHERKRTYKKLFTKPNGNTMEQLTKEIALAPSDNSFKSRLDSHLERIRGKTRIDT